MWRWAVVTACLALAGCGSGTAQLLHPATRALSAPAPAPPSPPRTRTPPRTPPRTPTQTVAQASPAVSVYLARLGEEQTRLADEEQRIPTSPHTPAALVRSIDLLAAAVRRLADGLSAIKPPATVAADHAHLVTIMRTYAARLDQAARLASARNGEQRAGALLIGATNQASQAFTITTTKIDSTLSH